MNDDFKIRKCIETFGEMNHIQDLGLDAGGAAGLKLVSGQEVFFRFARDLNRLYIYAIVAPFSANTHPNLVVSILKNNCLESDTEGGVISVSEFLGAFIYHISLPADAVTPARLESEVMDFLAKKHRVARLFNGK